MSPRVPLCRWTLLIALASSLSGADRSMRLREQLTLGAISSAILTTIFGLLAIWTYFVEFGWSVPEDSLLFSDVKQSPIKDDLRPVIAAMDFEDYLHKNGLGRLIVVSDRRDRTLVVSGKLRNSDQPSWIEALGWFDQKHGMSLYLAPRITSLEDTVTLPFAIEAVWKGSEPWLILNGGARRHLGETLPGGWTLDKIEENDFTISNERETLTVRLQSSGNDLATSER